MRLEERRIGVAAALVLAAALPARGGSGSPAEAEVRARSRAVAAAEAQLDADAVMPFWTEDAVVHFSGAEPIVGREAIHKMYADVFPKLKSFRGEATAIHASASGDMAWETGRSFSVRADPADGTESSSKYLLVWRKDPDGVWRIAACAATANAKPKP